MSLWRQLSRGGRALFRRAEADQDIADEVQHFMAAAEADLVSRGMTPEDARRAVRQQYGDAGTVREDVRAYGWENAVESAVADLRYAARRVRRGPGFAAVTILTLGLGIGAATAILSVVSPVLLAPLAYPDPERLVTLADLGDDGLPIPATFGTYREVAERSHSFEALAVSRTWQPSLTGGDEPELLRGERVSADYFRVLGITPLLGRMPDASDDVPGGRDVVMLGHETWRSSFASDSAVVGKDIRLDGRPYTVVGVLPGAFEAIPGRPDQIWSLLQYDPVLPDFETREWGHHLDMIGRLRDGATLDDARAELAGIGARPMTELPRPPWASMARGLSVRSLASEVTAGPRPALLALLGAAGLLLGIACMNVANLVLAKSARRRGELAMRAALGAARGRVARQLVTESLLLSGLGAALGLLLAGLGIEVLMALGPPSLPRLDAVRLDATGYLFALGIAAAVGLLAGLAPLVVSWTGDIGRGLRDASRSGAAGHAATRRGFVVAEVALALVLLVAAGLLLRSVQSIFSVAPGFDARDRLALKVHTSGARFATDDDVHRFYTEVLEAVGQVPGVTSAALTSQLPLSGDPPDRYGINFDDDIRPQDVDRSAHRYTVSPEYFRTMGIALLRGRALGPADVDDAPGAIVVGDAFVRSAFPGRDPIGQRVHAGRPDLPPYTIVGVVSDVKQASLGEGLRDAFYVLREQWYFADASLWVVVHAEGNPAGLAAAIRRAVWSVDADQPVVEVATLEDLVVDSEAQRRFAMVILEGFALLALALAAVGLYGVMAASVTDRFREIGVRAALGASREHLVTSVLRQGMALTGVGVGIGLLAAAGTSRLLRALLFGVSPLDAPTYAGVVGLVTLVAAAACGIPARRASRVDPVTALGVE